MTTSITKPPWQAAPETYKIDCCGYIQVKDRDERRIQFWNIIFDEANAVFDQLASREVFGNKDTCKAQQLMDLHHLLLFLEMIQIERNFDMDISVTGLDQGTQYYIDTYCTKDIQNKFYCKGYNVATILKIFQLFNLYYVEEDEDGIGFMQIGGTTDPINRVF